MYPNSGSSLRDVICEICDICLNFHACKSFGLCVYFAISATKVLFLQNLLIIMISIIAVITISPRIGHYLTIVARPYGVVNLFLRVLQNCSFFIRQLHFLLYGPD